MIQTIVQHVAAYVMGARSIPHYPSPVQPALRSFAVGSLSHRWFGAVGGLSDGVSSARAEEAAGARAEREKLHAVVMDPRHDRWVDHRMRNVHFHLTKHDGQSQS